MKRSPKQPPGDAEAQGADRRAHPRQLVSTRSAVWLDEGPTHGVIGSVFDLGMGGFSTRLIADPHEGLVPGATLYCVLLIRGATLDCLATIRSSVALESGETQLGMSVESMSEDNVRLLTGILRFLESHEGD